MSNLAELLWDALSTYGYLGVFAASLLGSLIPFISAPYVLPIILGIIAGRFDPALTALSSASGATLAKLVLFRGFQAGRILLDEKTKERMKPLEGLLLRYGWLAVFVAAATPLPDDIVFVPMALANYKILHFAAAVFGGKVVIMAVVAYASFYWKDIACYFIECAPGGGLTGGIILLAIGTAAAALIAAYAVTRLDWTKILQRYAP